MKYIKQIIQKGEGQTEDEKRFEQGLVEILGVRFNILSNQFKDYLRQQTEIMTNKEKQK